MSDMQLFEALRAVVREETGYLAAQVDENDKQLRELIGSLATQKTVDENDRQLRELISTLATQETVANLSTQVVQNDEQLRELISSLATQKTVDENNRHLRVLIENSMSRIENLLREDYGRVAGAAKKVADYDEVKGAVTRHESALENHNKRLTELEKKAM